MARDEERLSPCATSYVPHMAKVSAKEPEDYSPEEREAMGEEFFRWRYCPVCKTDSPTTEEVPPYAWVHDLNTGEHRARPKG